MPAPHRIAVYPGTFDPATNGHIDIVRRSLEIFDEVIVALAGNIRKAPLFTNAERKELLLSSLGADAARVEIDSFEGLLADYCRRRGVNVIVRGLRALADFEYEFQFALANRRLAPEIDTVFLMTAEQNFYNSSSLVKELAGFGGDVSGLVPPTVGAALRAKFPRPPG